MNFDSAVFVVFRFSAVTETVSGKDMSSEAISCLMLLLFGLTENASNRGGVTETCGFGQVDLTESNWLASVD